MIDERLSEVCDCLYRVAAKALVVRSGKILLVKERRGFYGFPGGGVECGENFSQTIIRELHEEIGLDIVESQIAENPHFIMSGHVVDKIPRLMLYFKVTTDENPTEQELPFIWADMDEFDELDIANKKNVAYFAKIRSEIANLLGQN